MFTFKKGDGVMRKIKKNILKEMADNKITIAELSKFTGINKLKLLTKEEKSESEN